MLNISGILFFSTTGFILSLLFLFNNYHNYFEDYYISYAQSIYPITFIYNTNLANQTLKDITQKKEIYIRSYEDMKIFFHNKENIIYENIKSLGIRSFDKQHIPPIIKDVYQENTIHISDSLYRHITSNKNYTKYISLGNKNAKFKIKLFNTHLEEDFILIDNKVAKQMWGETFFNITNIYSTYSNKYIKNKYKKQNINVSSWRDEIPFFNKVFYNIFDYLFTTYGAIFIILISIFSIFFLLSFIEDIKKAICQIFYFGNSFLYTLSVVFLIAFIICSSLFVCSFLLYMFLNRLLIEYILYDFKNIPTTTYDIQILYALIVVFIFSVIFTISTKKERLC